MMAEHLPRSRRAQSPSHLFSHPITDERGIQMPLVPEAQLLLLPAPYPTPPPPTHHLPPIRPSLLSFKDSQRHSPQRDKNDSGRHNTAALCAAVRGGRPVGYRGAAATRIEMQMLNLLARQQSCALRKTIRMRLPPLVAGAEGSQRWGRCCLKAHVACHVTGQRPAAAKTTMGPLSSPFWSWPFPLSYGRLSARQASTCQAWKADTGTKLFHPSLWTR